MNLFNNYENFILSLLNSIYLSNFDSNYIYYYNNNLFIYNIIQKLKPFIKLSFIYWLLNWYCFIYTEFIWNWNFYNNLIIAYMSKYNIDLVDFYKNINLEVWYNPGHKSFIKFKTILLYLFFSEKTSWFKYEYIFNWFTKYNVLFNKNRIYFFIV